MKAEKGSNTSNQKNAASQTNSFWRRRGIVTTSVVFSLVTLGVGLTPVILTATSLRNRLLNSAVRNEELTATAEAASGGWIAPLMFQDVRIADKDGAFLWTVKEIQTSRGLLSFIAATDQVNHLRLTDSSLKVRLTSEGKWPIASKSRPSKAQLSFHIENGSLELSVPWRDVPIVDLEQLTVTGSIAPDSAGRRMLHVEPVQLLDHAQITESNTQQNLALIAPVLAQSTTLSGSASVWLDEIRLPLDDPAASEPALSETPGAEPRGTEPSVVLDIPIHGHAEFHELDARLKDNWVRQLTAMIGQVSGKEVPNQVQVLKNSTVRFSVSKGGIKHEGMVFLLPQLARELTFTSSGIVRIDETLDLLLTLNLPKIVPAGRPILTLLSRLTEAPIQVQIVGTVAEPKFQLPEGMDLLSSLKSQIAPAQHTEDAPVLPTAVIDLIESVGSQDHEQARKDLPGNILNIIRAVDEQAKQKREERRSRQK